MLCFTSRKQAVRCKSAKHNDALNLKHEIRLIHSGWGKAQPLYSVCTHSSSKYSITFRNRLKQRILKRTRVYTTLLAIFICHFFLEQITQSGRNFAAS